jgi:hypothetical protein
MKTRRQIFNKIRDDKYKELMKKNGKKHLHIFESYVTLYMEIDGFCDRLKNIHDLCIRKANIYAVENTERTYREQSKD